MLHSFGIDFRPYTCLAERFRDLILRRAVRGELPATFADGVANLAVLDAIRRSAPAFVMDGGVVAVGARAGVDYCDFADGHAEAVRDAG